MGGRASRAALAVLCAGALLATSCGSRGSEALGRDESEALRQARERIDQALATEQLLSSSPTEARTLEGDVRAVIRRRDLRAEELDEFGLASLGELRLLVPSLVTEGADAEDALDRGAADDFLRYARSNPPRALLGPLTDQVELIERELADSRPDLTETVPQPSPTAPSQPTVDDYLSELEQDLDPAWPELGDRLASLRSDLGA